jgi:peroxiredoxin
VASGTREGGLQWLETYKSPFPLLLDQDLVLYRMFGIRRLLKVAWDLKVFIAYAEAVVKGRVDNIAYSGDDVTVIGGDFIVDSSGKVLYSYRSKEQYDRPQVEKLLEPLS